MIATARRSSLCSSSARTSKYFLRFYLLAILLVGGTAFTSCSSGPSNNEIESAVRTALGRKVPGPLVRYATGGEKAQISELRINAKGKPQVEQNVTYWPVKIFSKGTCVVLFGDKKSFEGEIEYFVYQDPYGEWKAEYRGL